LQLAAIDFKMDAFDPLEIIKFADPNCCEFCVRRQGIQVLTNDLLTLLESVCQNFVAYFVSRCLGVR
jgi:hypothetical protein